MSAIYGNAVGNTAPIKTLKIVDESNNEYVGVITGSEVIFTATDNDVREGMVYASDAGVSTGTKDIPPYYTTGGFKKIPSGGAFIISDFPYYDYTKLQVIICTYNTSMTDSVAAEKVSINGKVYAVSSTDVLSTVVVDHENGAINLGIINEGDNPCVMRYFTYKEEN